MFRNIKKKKELLYLYGGLQEYTYIYYIYLTLCWEICIPETEFILVIIK